MTIRTIGVTITGTSALLMHAFPLHPVEGADKRTPQEQAEMHTYRDPEGLLYVPGVNLQRGLIAGAAYSKGKGRSTLAKPVAACVMVTAERVVLSAQTFTVDSRAVVIPATKGRIVRHRARFDTWQLAFTLEYDDLLLRESEVRRVVDDTGTRVGLLDFRPERKGPFGRFVVTAWAP